jgi:hypothetical protein
MLSPFHPPQINPKNAFEKVQMLWGKIIFRYPDVPQTDDLWNILCNKRKEILTIIIELNNFSNNVCIFQVKAKRGVKRMAI